ncbi:SRPBCC family protein [Roseivivax isoporae]|uniref:DNA polymerase III subunits gamma and tau n=1 Tax=Roseivivax isoporae LMG 25204 TaxID=1449351 RepID=X7FAN8_9RHOB|nr:SRPBCC family protein [Roseivivax isoporae]ETX29860.1 DNA polymerase III subunits gamma and tau [Roseivivax isoporae LMG 25204]
MQFSVREDIEGGQEQVFAALSDFGALERSAMRRGLELERIDARAEPGPGMAWRTVFTFRGKPREATITLTEYDPPNRMVFDSVSGGLEVRSVLDLVALSRTRTRIAGDLTLLPKTLSARLLVQSLKLARTRAERKVKARASDYARDLEARLKQG